MITKQDINRLLHAISAGMVVLDHCATPQPTATIRAPRNPELLSDDDWLLLLRVGGELRTILEELDYHVIG